jgi:hypothetical protein
VRCEEVLHRCDRRRVAHDDRQIGAEGCIGIAARPFLSAPASPQRRHLCSCVGYLWSRCDVCIRIAGFAFITAEEALSFPGHRLYR